MGFESIDQPAWSSVVNIIQKEAFHFIGWRGVVDGVWVHWPVWPTSEVECNTKMSISFFLAGDSWWMGFKSIDKPSWSSEVERNPKMSISFYWLETGGGWDLSPLTSPADHQKLNVIKKVAFYFFWLKRAGRWGSIPLTSLADHQKLNVILKWAFHFIGWRGVVDGVWVHWPVWPIIQIERNLKMSISFYWLERGGKWGSSPSTSLADHQKWT